MSIHASGHKYSKKEKARMKECYVSALKKTFGIVTKAAEACGIHRTTIQRWRSEDSEFDAACAECLEIGLDFAESALMKNIQAGDTRAIIFFLERKGRSRGYGAITDINAELTVKRPRVVFDDVPEAELVEAQIKTLSESAEGKNDD